MLELLSIAFFGALGALLRFGTNIWAGRLIGTGFPYGTLIVNLIGCAALGFLMELALAPKGMPRALRTGLTVGFLGALTTFSTFGFETVSLIRQGALLEAVLNVALNVVVGLLAVALGIFVYKTIFGGQSL